MVQNIISTVNPPGLQLELGRFVLPDQSDEIKWAYAGSIVLNTKLEWERQQRHYPVPCKLVEDYEPVAMDSFLTDTSKLKKADRQPINPCKIAEYVLSESPVTIYICKVRDNWAATFISKSVEICSAMSHTSFYKTPTSGLHTSTQMTESVSLQGSLVCSKAIFIVTNTDFGIKMEITDGCVMNLG